MLQTALNPVESPLRSPASPSSANIHVAQVPCGVGPTALLARRLSVARAGETIFREGEPRDAIYQVAHGLVRTVRQTSEGRRIVQSFCVPGDIFGMSCTSTHAATAEAVSDVQLVKLEAGQFETWLACDGATARQLWDWLVKTSERVDQLRLMARGRSIEKLSYFLLDLAERLSARTRIELQMSRYDIGDYLGLSSETVSRTFTLLRLRGHISLDGHVVNLLNPHALRQLSLSCGTSQTED